MRVLSQAILCFLAGAAAPFATALAVEAGGIPAAPAESSRPAAKMPADAAIAETVLAAFADRRVDVAGASLELSGVSARSAIAADAELAVERLAYQPAGRRFTAVLTAASRGVPPQRFTVAGRLRQQIEVPVLNRRLQAGEVITPADLQWVAVGDRGLPGNAVYDAQELIGRTPRRSLPAGAPLIAADLKRPTAVAKGALVTLILSTPNMRLTARGRAVDEGAIGDTIRVANAQSRTVVAGVVLANGQVAVDEASVPASR
jgi:flagellar basal body P-ring formation protein FlgA